MQYAFLLEGRPLAVASRHQAVVTGEIAGVIEPCLSAYGVRQGEPATGEVRGYKVTGFKFESSSETPVDVAVKVCLSFALGEVPEVIVAESGVKEAREEDRRISVSSGGKGASMKVVESEKRDEESEGVSEKEESRVLDKGIKKDELYKVEFEEVA